MGGGPLLFYFIGFLTQIGAASHKKVSTLTGTNYGVEVEVDSLNKAPSRFALGHGPHVQ